MNWKKEAGSIIGLTAIFIITFLISVYEMSFSYSDYSVHTEIAMSLSDDFFSFLKANLYPVWHILVWICTTAFTIPQIYAAPFVSAFVNAIVYLAVYKLLQKEFPKQNILCACLTAAVCVVGPIYLPWYNENLYLGQGTPNLWHNPTNLMVKPVAVITFFYFLHLFKAENVTKKQYIIFSLFLIFSVSCKPSFVQIFLPGAAVLLIIHWILTKKKFRFSINIAFAYIPVVLLVIVQYVMTFWGTEGLNSGEGVIFAWLEVLGFWAPNVFISTILLPMLFPMYALLIDFRNNLQDREVWLALCCFCTAWLEAAVLAENGKRMYDGNFTWGLYIAMFLMWVVMLKRFIKYCKNTVSSVPDVFLSVKLKGYKIYIGLILFSVHIFCGLYYFYYLVSKGAWF